MYLIIVIIARLQYQSATTEWITAYKTWTTHDESSAKNPLIILFDVELRYTI